MQFIFIRGFVLLPLSIIAGIVGCNGKSEQTSSSVQSANLNIAQWEANMLSYGSQHCSQLIANTGSFDEKLSETYYDAESIYYQIAAYTEDESWLACARAAEIIYRDKYVEPQGGLVPGYWIFTDGLAEDYLQTGDLRSKEAIFMLADNAAFASDATPPDSTVDAALSREVAYSIEAYLNAEKVGSPRRERIFQLEQHALGHLKQWFVEHSSQDVRPFMVGLTARALINFDEIIGDPEIVVNLKLAADWMWENIWISTTQSFRYSSSDLSEGSSAPDLNMLIAPLYSWLYYKTGELKYHQQAQAIFNGGVEGAYLSGAKQFNQSYRWSFQFLRWNSVPPSTKK